MRGARCEGVGVPRTYKSQANIDTMFSTSLTSSLRGLSTGVLVSLKRFGIFLCLAKIALI